MATKARKIMPFDDSAAIFFSQEDNCWIAHSLRTDQIGTGKNAVDALADVIRAVNQVCCQAQCDKSLAYLREAPPKIQKIAKSTCKLPHYPQAITQTFCIDLRDALGN